MKKVILLLAFVALGAASYGQDFLGIKPSGSKDYTVNQFKAKGFYVATSAGNVVGLKGKLNGQMIELNIVYTPITKTVCKFSIYMPEQTSFYYLKEEYEKYVDVFQTKYGIPTSKYEYFVSPYYDGDGYELQAVAMEKAIFSTYWFGNTMNLSVNISEWKQVNIVYENVANMTLKETETNRLNINAF